MSTKFLSPGWRMPRNANQGKNTNYSLSSSASNNAINFNYTDEFMSGQNPWTLSLWILWTSQPVTYKGYFFKGQSTSRSLVALYGDGAAIKFMCQGDDFFIPTFQTPSSVTVNKWYNLVVTYDGNLTIKAYVDNILDATHTLGSPLSIGGGSNTNYFQLFQYNGSTIYGPSNARLSDLSIFDYELSPSQITTLYGDSTNGVGNPMALPVPPKAYYPLGTSAWNGDFLVENNAIKDYVFSFDGSDDYISASGANLPTGNSSFTASCWFRRNGTQTNYAALLSWGTEATREKVNILFAPNGTSLRFAFFGDDLPVLGAVAISDNIWYNVVLTYNGSVAKMYINGTLEASHTLGGALNISSSYPLLIGKYSTYEFKGSISNVQIFNTLLSVTDIQTLYNYGSPIRTLANIPQSSNLKAWYKLDASEIYNSTSTEWEINDATAVIKTTALQNAPSSARLQAPNVITNGSTAMSFSTWVYYPRSFNTSEYLRVCNAQQYMYVGNFQNNYVHLRNGGGFSAVFNEQIVPGQWNHIVVSTEYVGSTWTSKLRLNGGTVDTQTGSGNTSINISSEDLDVTAWGYGNYSGSVLTSNSIIWDNKALTDSELLDVYNAFSVSDGVPTVQPSSISSFPQSASISGWYKLDNEPLLDSSGNNNTLLLSNGGTEVGPSLSNNIGKSSGMSQSNLVQSNLQTVAPYSKYAMNFDGTDYINIGSFSLNASAGTVSAWIKTSQASDFQMIISKSNGGAGSQLQFRTNADGIFRVILNHSSTVTVIDSATAVNDGNWHNLVFTYSSSGMNLYIDGYLSNSNTTSVTSVDSSTESFMIGARKISAPEKFFNGSISNVSVWNTSLTSTQVSAIYNQGLPSNLNSHSAYSNLVSWWQLGENSSYVGGATNPWTFADEMPAGNNGTSGNLPETALTNGVGTTANGVSTNIVEGNLLGNAPYSTANAISSGMAVTARGTDVP